jgi:hypothetical protein
VVNQIISLECVDTNSAVAASYKRLNCLQLNITTDTVLGRFEATICFKSNELFPPFIPFMYVLHDDNGSVITGLGVIDHHVEHEHLTAQYPNLIKGIGNFKGVNVKPHTKKYLLCFILNFCRAILKNYV